MGMDRPGIEPDPSRMLSGCDTTTPTGPEPRPRVLKCLLGTAFRAEALSRPARSASFLPFCCRRTPFGWCSLWAIKCGLARSASFLPFCCRRTPFGWCSLWTNECAWTSAGSKAFVAGRSLWTDGALLWFVPGIGKRCQAWTGRGLNPAPLAC